MKSWSAWSLSHALRLAALITVIAPLSGCTDSSASTEHVDGTHFVRDADGRVVILRGMNIMSSAKGNADRLPDLVEEDVERYAQLWGFNVVRYLIFWDAIEPSPGEFDQEYLDKTEERLDWFAANDVAVILDMHQDVYAQYFCCDGAPDWAIEDDDIPFEQNPIWDFNYFHPAVIAAFDNFFDFAGEHGRLQTHFAGAWAEVVRRFKDHPALIGYDILNEPSPGSALDAVDFTFTPDDGPVAEFDRTLLTEFYQRLIDSIREVDGEGWILYEPRYAAPANGQPSFILELDDPREGSPRIVYSPHLYSISMEFNRHYDPSTDVTLANWEANRGIEVDLQKAPLLIGEWGVDPGWGSAELFMRELLDMSDRMMASWTYWSYDPGGWGIWERGSEGEFVERENANIIVRPYPRTVAGIPRSFSYDPDSRIFSLAFDPDPSATVPTEIYVPEARHYRNGWSLTGCEEARGCASVWNQDTEILEILTPGQSAGVELTITPDG